MPFDLDDFGVAAGADTRPVLSWRESPETSLADWTLKVSKPGRSGKPKEYHCHKTALGVGPRSLPYFERIFQGSGLAEHVDNMSEIELQASAADAVPVLLDFVYLGTLKATTANAAALMYLSRYFQSKVAFTEVQKFIQDDLDFKTAPTYLAEATLYALEKVAAAAAELCAASCDSIEVGGMDVLTPDLFLRVLQTKGLKHTSQRLSLHIASFCRVHARELDGILLNAMTSPNLLPTVHVDAALPLLHLALQYPAVGSTDLRNRCIQAISQNYRHLFPSICVASPADMEPDEPVSKRLRRASTSDSVATTRRTKDKGDAAASRLTLQRLKLPDSVKIDVLEGALGAAHLQLDSMAAALKKAQAEAAAHAVILRKFQRVPKAAQLKSDNGTAHIHSTAGETYEKKRDRPVSPTLSSIYLNRTDFVPKYTGKAPSGLPPGHTDPQGWSVIGRDLGESQYSRHRNKSYALFYYKA